MFIKKFFSRLFYIINIPGHIKRVYLRIKINKNKQSKSSGRKQKRWPNIILIILLLGGIIYLNYLYQDEKLMIGSFIFVLLLFVILKKTSEKKDSNQDRIERIILQDENSEIIKQWKIEDKMSILIGKKTDNNEVDVDLSKAVYSTLVSRRHAVMNKTNNKWYFEDVDSFNGSGIKRYESKEKFRVKRGKAYRVYAGDEIYIANTKLVLE